MTFKQTFEIVKTTMGATSIKDLETGEILHNPVGPWEESRDLYVKQSHLKERLLDLTLSAPLVIYDVGLGAGFNAVAALEIFYNIKKSGEPSRDLQVISFETNLKLIDFFLDHIQTFPESLFFENQLKGLRNTGVYIEKNLHWQLLGDFCTLDSLNLPAAEVVFFDPYSPQKNPEMWSVKTFNLVEKHLNKEIPSCVLTYSTATPVRTAMLLSGLFVGQGQSTGLKRETTFGATTLEALERPLGKRWMERWQRSHTAMPLGDHKLSLESILKLLKTHPQFSYFSDEGLLQKR